MTIPKRRWTAEEDAALTARYPRGELDALVVQLGRTRAAIQQRAHELGVTTRKRTWFAADDEELRERYERGESRAEIAAALRRSVRAVGARAAYLGIRAKRPFWTAAEIEDLRRSFGKEHPSVIAKRLGKSLPAVKSQAFKLGLRYREARGWTTSELREIRKRYPTEPTHELARSLGRSAQAVQDRARIMGIRKTPFGLLMAHKHRSLRGWSRAEVQLLCELRPTTSAREIARRIGRTAAAVNQKARKLGLRFSGPPTDCGSGA